MVEISSRDFLKCQSHVCDHRVLQACKLALHTRVITNEIFGHQIDSNHLDKIVHQYFHYIQLIVRFCFVFVREEKFSSNS